MRKEQKRLRKQKKRQESNKKARLAENAQRIRRSKLSEYPEFVVGRTEADPAFIAAVLDATQRLDLLDTKSLGRGLQAFLKLGKLEGFSEAFRILQSADSIKTGEQKLTGNAKLAIAVTSVGSLVLSLVPEDIRQKYMPYNDVSVDPVHREIRLNFSSMESVSGSGGRSFFNPKRPKVEFDGTVHTVAFSRHSIERICKRINPRYIDYGPAGDIHAFFSACVYFEPVMLHGGQPAFAMFDMCGNEGFIHYQLYTVDIFGKENVKASEGSMYYRLGYCPVVFENGFAKAKTFIPPGFRGTPEYGLVLRSGLCGKERRSLLDRISDDSGNESEKLLRHDNASTKWFHENGLPQVFQWKRDVFVV